MVKHTPTDGHHGHDRRHDRPGVPMLPGLARPGPFTPADVTFLGRVKQGGRLLDDFSFGVSLHSEPIGKVQVEPAVVNGSNERTALVAQRLNDFAAEKGREALFSLLATNKMQIPYLPGE